MFKKIKGNLIYILYTGLLLFQLNELFGKGNVLNWRIHAVKGKHMLYEIIIFTVIILLVNYFIKRFHRKLIIGFLLLLGIAYFHQTIIPFLVSLAYFALVILSGSLIASFMIKRRAVRPFVYLLTSLLLGLNYVCITIGTLSSFQVYSIPLVWIILSVTGFGGLMANADFIKEQHRRITEMGLSSTVDIPSLSFIEMGLLIQLARVGLQKDYDAVWYGLRSSYVLANSAKGIFEDLHLVGFTYLYSKGFEIMLLPLSKLNSWNYQFLFNGLLVLTIVIICYYFSRELTTRKNAWRICAIAATLPCLLNMGVTVKPDVITCLFQLAGIFLVIISQKDHDPLYLYIAGMCLISSYGFKTTSLLFTSVIIIGMLPFIDYKRIKMNTRGAAVVLFGLLTLTVIWGRTFAITGSPLISYLGRIYEFLGLPVKYPYALLSSVNQVSATTATNLFSKVLDGISGYFIYPAKFDHVIIAWGTALPLLLILSSALLAIFKRHKLHFQWVWLMSLLSLSVLFSIAILDQYDGNYFLLFYVASIVICGSYILNNIYYLFKLVYISLIFNIVVSGFTSWTGSLGFTQIDVVNKGYINQQRKIDRKIRKSEIFSLTNARPDNKCIAATYDVNDLLKLKCISESWLDIISGNPGIIKDAASLAEYITRCGISYIYINNDSFGIGSNADLLLEDLIKLNMVSDIICEEKQALLIIGDTADPKHMEELCYEFEHR